MCHNALLVFVHPARHAAMCVWCAATLACAQTRILSERADARREGEMLRQRAVQEAEEMAAKEKARLETARKFNEDTKEANRTLQVGLGSGGW